MVAAPWAAGGRVWSTGVTGAVDGIPRCRYLGRKILRMAEPLEPIYEFPSVWCTHLHGVVNHEDDDQRNGISI